MFSNSIFFSFKGDNDFKLEQFLAGTPETFEPHYGKFVMFEYKFFLVLVIKLVENLDFSSCSKFNLDNQTSCNSFRLPLIKIEDKRVKMLGF